MTQAAPLPSDSPRSPPKPSARGSQARLPAVGASVLGGRVAVPQGRWRFEASRQAAVADHERRARPTNERGIVAHAAHLAENAEAARAAGAVGVIEAHVGAGLADPPFLGHVPVTAGHITDRIRTGIFCGLALFILAPCRAFITGGGRATGAGGLARLNGGVADGVKPGEFVRLAVGEAAQQVCGDPFVEVVVAATAAADEQHPVEGAALWVMLAAH
jgi:hypothetical protein